MRHLLFLNLLALHCSRRPLERVCAHVAVLLFGEGVARQGQLQRGQSQSYARRRRNRKRPDEREQKQSSTTYFKVHVRRVKPEASNALLGTEVWHSAEILPLGQPCADLKDVVSFSLVFSCLAASRSSSPLPSIGPSRRRIKRGAYRGGLPAAPRFLVCQEAEDCGG